MKKGSLFIISGPSGAGKTSLTKAVCEKLDHIVISVSYTTREKRGEEKQASNYHFIEKEVFEKMFKTGKSPSNIAKEQDMEQITSDTSIRPIVEKIIDNNPKPVTDFLNGKETAFKFLVGQVMKVTRGRADPKLVAELVKGKLESMR